MYMIAIDSGTTNSRIRLVNDKQNKVIDVIKLNVGVRNTAIDGNADVLKRKIAEGLQEIILRNNLRSTDIQYIVAAGMITSNLGLFEVKHIEAPAKLEDFAKASSVRTEDYFCHIPCIFVPGMKNKIEYYEGELADQLDRHDVMRGEEVESFGLVNQIGLQGKGMIVLPGSHTKFVFMEDRQIESCYSTLCGELLFAVSRETILSSSLDKELITSVEPEYLIEGYKASEKFGLTRALYHVRLADVFNQMNKNQRANYLVGAVMSCDIRTILKSKRLEELDYVVIGGGNPLRRAFGEIFSYLDLKNVTVSSDEQVDFSTVIGSKVIGDIVFLTTITSKRGG
ncbi:2-dehydro-3-deoxygalactonokinase [Bacillus sp. USDA818B3_A]|uniref:2-dehydro-3-deoxygalactonokinase n=1 Tax=Bacillus sp. USDA818B3_A TaxID=2698834 RepID=UPI00136B2435|nr:2-dehydro-3-deoxygalactonokinase [Bacillus sp. USDA818B3_A]